MFCAVIRIVFVAVCLYPLAGFSAPVLFLVGNEDHTQDEVLIDIDSRILVKSVWVKGLSELNQKFKEALRPDDTVIGIVLHGHGNYRMFALSKTQKYGGRALASYITNGLTDIPLQDRLFVHLWGCQMAKRPLFGGSLQDEVLKVLINDVHTKKLSVQSLDVSAHFFWKIQALL